MTRLQRLRRRLQLREWLKDHNGIDFLTNKELENPRLRSVFLNIFNIVDSACSSEPDQTEWEMIKSLTKYEHDSVHLSSRKIGQHANDVDYIVELRGHTTNYEIIYFAGKTYHEALNMARLYFNLHERILPG